MENVESVEHLIKENKDLIEEYKIIIDEKTTYVDLYITIDFLNELEENQELLTKYDIFTKGDVDHAFWEYLRDLEVKAEGRPYIESLQKANFFIMQIATMRRFWMQIQKALEA